MKAKINSIGAKGHTYSVAGRIFGRSVNAGGFPTRPAAEGFACALIGANGLQVETEEYGDKHVDVWHCAGDKAIFSICRA